MQAARRTIPPTIRMLYDELQATEEEFDGLEIDDTMLSITTEPIELEGIRLGPFAIHLDTGRLSHDSPYSIIALGTASGRIIERNDASPRPWRTLMSRRRPQRHRRSPGGRAVVRLLTVVDRILHTYSEGSAYVELNNWYGKPCHDCDCTVDEDDA